MKNSTHSNGEITKSSDETASTKRLFVDLWAHETLVQQKRMVIEVPADCGIDELSDLDGTTLDEWTGMQCDWETEYSDAFEVLEEIDFEDGVPEHLETDLVLVRAENGDLVNQDPES